MITQRRRAYRRVHRTRGFPSCLPAKTDIQAAYLGKVSPSSAGVVYDESINSNNAQLVNSQCATFDETAKLIIVGLVGTETISNEGTAVGTVGVGEITFTAGTCWNIELSNGSKYACAEGGLSDALYDYVNGVNATITGATLSTFWGSAQDVYHYNFLNGFDLYENGTAGQEIRVPVGATVATAGYTYTSTNIAGKWHNNAESKIQLPSNLSSIQDITPISSLTNNKHLEWVDGEIREFSKAGNVTEITGGTYINSFDGVFASITCLDCVESGKTYKYYIEASNVTGSPVVGIGSSVNVLVEGINEGSILSDNTYVLIKRSGVSALTVYKFYVWEAGTVPPLSYEEMETNFNSANRAFSSLEEDKHSKLVFYDRVLTTEELLQVQKCLYVKNSEFVLTDENGVVLTDENGLILVAE